MFKKLHLQLTFFCTFVSGFILVIMSFVCLFFSETETKENFFTDFQKDINVLMNHLENQSVLSYVWLAQLHADTRYEIDILDNGSKLVFESLNSGQANDSVFAQARQIALDEYMIMEESMYRQSVLSKHAEFEMESSSNQNYYASVALIPKNGGILNIAVLYPTDELRQKILSNRLLFFLADFVGIVLLGIFFRIFTLRMMQPIILNRKKQAEFIASASHELRSPLTVMLSCLSAMKQASPQEAEHFSMAIEQEGKRMSRLIDDMLTLSNTDNSQFTIHKTDVELDTLLLSVYENFEMLARGKHISLRITLPEDVDTHCFCDNERILQVLSILVDNALSYTPDGGQICLLLASTYENKAKNFFIRVEDTGIGIPDEEKEAVFDRFYRCDKSHKDKSHFGLGLCIAQEIIHLHKGRLWVEDTPGGGASFVMVLPAPVSKEPLI